MPDPNTQHLKDLAENSDHALVQGAKYLQAVKDLEMPIEGQLMKLDEISRNTKKDPEAVQKVSLEGVSVVTIKGDKGDTGNIFDELTPEQKQSIKGEKGDKGEKGEKGEVGDIGSDGAQGIQGIQGERGEQGVQGIQGIQGLQGETGPQGLRGTKGEPGSPDTAKEILTKIKGKYSYDDLKDLPNLETFRGRHQASRDYDLSELKDVSIPNPTNGYVLTYSTTLRKWIASPGGISSGITGLISQGTNITITGTGTLADPYVINSTASGGGGGITAWSTPAEVPNGVITAFTVSGTPTDVVADGTTYYEGFGYSLIAGQIVFVNEPTQYVRYRVATAWSTPPETPNGSILTFTVGAVAPTDVVADGSMYYNGAGYTFSAGQITFVNEPTQYVRYR